MNPQSSIVRHLSGRSDKFGSSEISIPVPDIGKENRGYDSSGSEMQKQVRSTLYSHCINVLFLTSENAISEIIHSLS